MTILAVVQAKGHDPGSAVGAAKQGFQIGAVGYIIGWLISRPIVAAIMTNKGRRRSIHEE